MGLLDGLVGLWHLNNNLEDSGPNGYNGQMIGAPVFVPAKLGSHGLSFDGIDDAVNCNFSLLNFTALTAMAWIYAPSPLATGSADVIIAQWGSVSGPHRVFALEKFINDRLSISVSADGENVIYIEEPVTLPTNVWQQALLEWNGSLISLYRNNELKASAGLGALCNASSRVGIGAIVSRPGDPLASQAKLITDEVAMWNRTLSPAEKNEIWNNGDGIEIGAEVRSRRTRQMRATFFR